VYLKGYFGDFGLDFVYFTKRILEISEQILRNSQSVFWRFRIRLCVFQSRILEILGEILRISKAYFGDFGAASSLMCIPFRTTLLFINMPHFSCEEEDVNFERQISRILET